MVKIVNIDKNINITSSPKRKYILHINSLISPLVKTLIKCNFDLLKIQVDYFNFICKMGNKFFHFLCIINSENYFINAKLLDFLILKFIF